MSASKQKKIRNGIRAEGTDKKAEAQLEAEQKSRKFKRNTIIAVAVIAVAVIAALFINSNYLYTKAPAVRVGDTDYSATEFNYYYKNAYSSFYETYSDYISFFLDPSTPLDKQACTFSDEEDYTWADYFADQAKSNLKQITALYDEATEKGFVPSEEDLASIDTSVSYYEAYAANNNLSLDGWLALNFGKGMDEKAYRDVMTKYVTAYAYGKSIQDGFTYSAEELDAHYAELADQYDRLTYYSYLVTNSDEAFADITDDAAKAEAVHAKAEEIAAATNPEQFAANVLEYVPEEQKEDFADADATLSKDYANALGDMSEWLLDPERKANDTTVLDNDAGSYAVMFVERDDNHYNMVNMRHMLVLAEEDADGVVTEEALQIAEEKAKMLYSMWLADGTEESFAEIANLNSEDEGSNTNGGLYENVYKGQMVEGIENFLFAEGRKAGDADIVYGSNGSYEGYHVVYYAGEGEQFSDYLSDTDLRNGDYEEYVLGLAENYEVSEKFAYNFASLN